MTSRMDRTGDPAALTFYVNGESVAKDPAFQVLEEELAGIVFFAVFGTPGFHVETLHDGEVCPWASDGRADGTEMSRDANDSAGHDRITVLSFNRHPQCFDEVLLTSSFAKRKMDEGIEIQPLWANGAKIFVPHLTASDLEECRMDPCVRHVVVKEEDEIEIHAILEAIPYKRRPRLKSGMPRMVIPANSDLSMFQGSSSSSSCDKNTLSSKGSDVVGFAACWEQSACMPIEQTPADITPRRIIVKHTFIDIVDDTSLDKRSTKSI